MPNIKSGYEKLLKHPLKRLGGYLVDFSRKVRDKAPSAGIVFFIVFLGWVFSGFYTIGPDELGVVQRWGKSVRQEKSGLHYHLPYPIEIVKKPKIKKVWRTEVGSTLSGARNDDGAEKATSESLFLTGDGNLVEIGFTVQYRINKAGDYLYSTDAPQRTVNSAAEAAMNEVIGLVALDQMLTVGKEQIQKDVATSLQAILDIYKAGVQIVTVQINNVNLPKPVQDTYEKVAAAREKKLLLINEARSYADELLAKSQGDAVAMVNLAKAYKEEKIKSSQGEVSRFLGLLEEFRNAPEVTRQRLYLETMENVISQAGKVVLGPEEWSMLPLINLPELEATESGGAGLKTIDR